MNRTRRSGLFSGFSKIVTTIIVLAVIVAIGMGGFLYYYLYLRIPMPNVSIEIAKPDRVLTGEPFTVTASYANNSEHILKGASFSFILPQELSFLERAGDERVYEEAIGDIGPGSIGQRNIKLIATGGVQSLERVEAKLRYQVLENSRSQFENSAYADISIAQPAVTLGLETPENVFSGERFNMTVNYENASNQEFKDVSLRFDYPPVFQFLESDREPESGKNIWNIGTLSAGEKGSVRITGTAVGEEASFFGIHVVADTQFFDKRYTLNEQSASIGISSAPLSLKLSVQNDPNYIANAGDGLRYALTYRNNSDAVLHNVLIRATLIGEMYDFATLRTGGAFNSISNAITWNVANTEGLGILESGEERTLSFDINLRNNFPIRRLGDKNYTVKVQAEIQSPTVPQGVEADKTLSIASIETKVAGKVDLVTLGYFYDADAGIVNRGPYPPVVNQPTQYSVHWKVTNYSTDLENVVISGFLQSGAVFTGVVKSNSDTKPVYDSGTGEVRWNIPNIPATRGIISEPFEAIFQVELTPAINQIRTDVAFLGETRLTARDVFTGLDVKNTALPVTTALPADTRITVSDRKVKE